MRVTYVSAAVLLTVGLGIGFSVGRAWRDGTARAEGAGGADAPDISCADLNADGSADLSDAVWLLAHLYSGGPPPVCPDRPPSAGVPDTGQSRCFDTAGEEVTCGVPSCPGQDGSYATGCPMQGRFVDHGDGTVTDTCTGLMWQKVPPRDQRTWCGALAYCEDLELGGHTDWRLPNVRELQTLVDCGRFNPSIAPVFEFVNGYYWTSTTFVGSTNFAWGVSFYYGLVSNSSKAGDVLLACAVRPAS